VLKSLPNGKGISIETPKVQERYRAIASWPPTSRRESFEKDGGFMDILREAQNMYFGAQIQITPVKAE
jgi:hypothetical protein